MGNILRLLQPLWPWAPPRQQKPDLKQTPIFAQLALEAARKGDVDRLQALSEDPHVLPGKTPLRHVEDALTGTTLLHEAMEGGHEECVRFLLAHGCDPARGNRSAETPLHVACMRDRLQCLKAASASARVDLEARDLWQRTPLLKAAAYGSEEVLRYLLGRGVDLDAQDAFQLSVLHVAASRNRADLVRELARRGANLDLPERRGRSVLSLAVSSARPAMVRELLLLGASTCARAASSSASAAPSPCVSAIQEFVRRVEGGAAPGESEEVLHALLAAHGHPLRADQPEVFQRLLYSSDLHRFLPLLQKVKVCSDSLCDDLHLQEGPADASASDERDGRSRSRSPSLPLPLPRVPMKLYDLARRSARQALMASGRNVVWAVERLGSGHPPALKGLLLLQDCDFKEFPGQVRP